MAKKRSGKKSGHSSGQKGMNRIGENQPIPPIKKVGGDNK